MSTIEPVCETRPFSNDAGAATMLPCMSDESFYNLVHDLRQPLSAIESIASYLELTVPPDQAQAHHYISRLHQLVADASGKISTAVSQVRRI